MKNDENFSKKTALPVVSQSGATGSASSVLDGKELLQELDVYKIELDMQNDELRRAMEELREHEEHLSKIIKNNPAGYFHLNPEGRFLEVNDAWLRMNGYESSAEVIGKHFSIMQVDSDLEATLKHVSQLLKGCPVPAGEYSSRRKDGSIAYFTYSALPVVHADKVLGLEWFIIDITERKKAEQERMLHEIRMARLTALSQHLFTTEQEFIDRALSEALGFTNSTVGYIYFYSEQKRQFTLNSWSGEAKKECTVAEQQTVYDLDKTGIWGEAVRQRGPIVLNDYQAHNPLKKGVPEGHVALRRFLTVPVISDGMIVAVIGVANKESDYTEVDVTQLTLFMDAVWKITASKRAEAEKRNLLSQLHQAQKMESIGWLAGGVAHDFNNMLSVILGHAEMSLLRMDHNNPLFSSLTEIRTAAERSADLTRQLLAFARKQTINPKVINLNETVAGMLSMLQRLIGENVQLTWKPATNLWPVMMDCPQIDQIMANLCVNARDAITNVGRIIIETGNCSIDEHYCAVHSYASPGEYVKIFVSDDGKGMGPETLEHIFEPFFTTKEVGEGTGLGLATVYGIVKQNNGFINVYSEPGIGTTFTIYLPRYQGETGEAQQEGAAEPSRRGHETILLVEDEAQILEMTALILTELGYQVLKANSPGEALQLARDYSGQIDLLLTDVIMPEMNGRDLANNLHSSYPKMQRLFMSGYTSGIIAHHGVLEEGVHFIQKPFQMNVLAAKLREVLDGSLDR